MSGWRWMLDLELRLLGGSWERRSVRLDLESPGLARVLIGSDEVCDVAIHTDQVDPVHLALVVDGEELFIEDLGSKRGTRLGTRVLPPGRTLIEPGAVFFPGGVAVRVMRSVVQTADEKCVRQAPENPPFPQPPAPPGRRAEVGDDAETLSRLPSWLRTSPTQSATASGPAMASGATGPGAPAANVVLDVQLEDRNGKRSVELSHVVPALGASCEWTVGDADDDDIRAEGLGGRLYLAWSASGLVWVRAEGADAEAWTAGGQRLKSACALDGHGEILAGGLKLRIGGWRLDVPRAPTGELSIPEGFDVLSSEEVEDDRGLGNFFPEHSKRIVLADYERPASAEVEAEGQGEGDPEGGEPEPIIIDDLKDVADIPAGSRWILVLRVRAPGATEGGARVERKVSSEGRASVVVGAAPHCDVVVSAPGVRPEHLAIILKHSVMWVHPLGVLGEARRRLPVGIGETVSLGAATLEILDTQLLR